MKPPNEKITAFDWCEKAMDNDVMQPPMEAYKHFLKSKVSGDCQWFIKNTKENKFAIAI